MLVSGGLDSAVLLAELARRHRNVWPVYIRQGLAWENVELYWLRRYLQHIRSLGQSPISNLHVLSLPMNDLYGAHWSTGRGPVPGAKSPDSAVYLPGRNLILSVKAAVFAAVRRIPLLAIGSLEHNPFPDADPAFFRRWGAALSVGLGTRLKVIAPYRRLSKAVVIARGREFPLELTFSCIAPRGRRHCGRCNKCAERRRAFRAAGVEDKTTYAAP